MDDPQNLDSQSLKDRAWTTDEIRKHSSNWTLAGDVRLFNFLNEFSHQIISRTHEVENAMDSLVHQTKMTSAKINNVINDFHMLSNLQFVENRVYDEEIQEAVPETKPVLSKTNQERESEMIPKILEAIQLGLNVLDTAFDRINVNEISDSEDEDVSSEGHTILEPKDPYECRPLPYIIGSEEFMKCDFAGLKDLVEDDVQSFSEESSISDTDETSSEGEPLPLDDDKFPEKQPNRMFENLDKVSSSDESELFGSEKEVNGYTSDTSLEFKPKEKNVQKPAVEVQPEKKPRQDSVSSMQAKLKLPQVLPVPKLQEKKNDDGDLFANEDDISDEESPFRKKTGLFASDTRFNDEKDSNDLFGGDLFKKSPMDDVVKEIKSEIKKPAAKKPQATKTPDKKKPLLFDNDEDSEDDIFNTLMKTKKSSPKSNNAESQDSSEKADTLSTPSSAPSTKPSGNAFDFVTGAGNSNSLFDDDSDGDDLFSSKKTQGKTFGYDASENDDLFGIISTKAPKESKGIEKSSLFEDNKTLDKPDSKKSLLVKKKTRDSIFEDSDSSDQEKKVPITSALPVSVKRKTDINLFGDDDDLEDDIFSQVKKATTLKTETKKLSLFVDEPKEAENKKLETAKAPEKSKPKPLSLFDDVDGIDSLQIKESSEKTIEKSKNISLFDDTEKSESTKPEPVKQIPPKSSLFEDSFDEGSLSSSIIVPKQEQKKTLSLFEDSDSFDLFAPKPSTKATESITSVQISKPSTPKQSSISKDETDGAASSKISLPVKTVDTDSQASFDAPVDNTNVLNVINKGRVKMTAKRRKPTRQGRLAALEKSADDDIIDEPSSTKSDISSTDDTSDSLFSSSTKKSEKPAKEPTKLDHKTQEKQKMNLMSQIMSEAASSRIGKKMTVEKEEEEDIDIFSEASRKDKSKSSFSFKPPEENTISSIFPIENKEAKNDEMNISKADSFEDDFFTEPAFQNFRSSISHKEPPNLNVETADNDDDDDLFSTIKSNLLPKSKPENDADIFDGDDDTDIFADIQKEKYEMFPNQIYDDDEDDIFATVSNTSSSKPSNISSVNKTTSSVKKVDKKEVDIFDDPLTGLLGDD